MKLTTWRQNPKVHHRIHNSPPPVPVLSQLDPIYTPLANLPKIHSDPIYALVNEPGNSQSSAVRNEMYLFSHEKAGSCPKKMLVSPFDLFPSLLHT
jgi:hypothetical protein